MVTIHDSMDQGRVAEAISIYYTVVKFLEGAAAFLGIGMQRSRSATLPDTNDGSQKHFWSVEAHSFSISLSS